MSNDDGGNFVDKDFDIVIEGGRPWGFTLQGGIDFRSPLVIGKITRGGKAEKVGLLAGDIILQVNGISTTTMKHHEAQRLIAASKQMLELKCTKTQPGSILSPKSSTQAYTFHYPSPPSSPKHGTHIRQRSLDFQLFRPRSSSDAGKRATVGQKIAGIKVPAPPPSGKRNSKADTDVSAPRYVAGIKVPAPPPSVKSKSTSSILLSQPIPCNGNVNVTEEAKVDTNVAEEAKVVTNVAEEAKVVTNVAEEAKVVTNVAEEAKVVTNVAEEAKVVTNTAEVDINITEETKVDTNNIAEKVIEDANATICEQPILTYVTQLNDIQHVSSYQSSSEENDNQHEVRSILSAIQSEFGPKTEEHTFDTTSDDATLESSHLDTSQSSISFPSSSEEPLPYVSGCGSDWYKSMFQNLKKGVEEQLPNKKHVCDRSPTPARKSIFENQSEAESKFSYQKRRYSESSISVGPTRSMARVSSSGNVDAVNTLHSGVVFRKNIQSYNSSRNYWKSIEKQASRERVELATQAKRHSLRRSASTNSTGEVSPENIQQLDEVKTSNTTDKSSSPPLFEEEASAKREPSPIAISVDNQESEKTNEPNTQSNSMSKLHPLLNDGTDDDNKDECLNTDDAEPSNIFNRIDPSKLNSALGNAVVLGKLQQDGIDPVALQTTAIALGQQQQTPEPVPQQRKKSKTIKPPPGEKAKALFDFEAASDKEISFKKGTVIDLTETVNSDWLKGTVDNQTGIFPTSYVKVLTSDEILQHALGSDPACDEPCLNILARANYDFTAKSAKEMSFNKGDILTLLKQIDDNWYEGALGDNKGIIPATYIQIFEQEQ